MSFSRQANTRVTQSSVRLPAAVSGFAQVESPAAEIRIHRLGQLRQVALETGFANGGHARRPNLTEPAWCYVLFHEVHPVVRHDPRKRDGATLLKAPGKAALSQPYVGLYRVDPGERYPI